MKKNNSENNNIQNIPLSREVILDGVVRKLATERDGENSSILSNEDLTISRQKFIPNNYSGPDIWVFGYGSLIWNPLMKFISKEKGKVFGYHRKFCLWTKIGRGTPDYPGLMLGLLNGGCVEGLAYKISSTDAASELDLLWKREMLNNSYEPKWLNVHTNNDQLKALSFVVKKTSPNFVNIKNLEEQSKIISKAKGYIGNCSQYLLQTEDALNEHDINDNYIRILSKYVKNKKIIY